MKEKGESMKKLTKKQVEIMKIFWASEHPLAASDILKLDESMNINTIRASYSEFTKKRIILKLRVLNIEEMYWART